MSPKKSNFGVGTRQSTFGVIEVDDGNFDYDDRIAVETSQKTWKDYWINPVGGVVNQRGPFLFTIEPMPDKYLQLNRAALELKLRIVREDGSACRQWEDVVAPINLLGPCFFESVEITLNGQPFAGASTINAGLKAYIETMLSYDSDARASHLNAQFFHLDSPGEYDTMSVSHNVLLDMVAKGIMADDIERPVIPGEYAPINPAVAQAWGDEVRAVTSHRISNEDIEATVDEEKRKWLQRCQLYQDYAMDRLGILGKLVAKKGESRNIGYDNRFHITGGSHVFDMYSPITHDFFRLNNHVGPGNKIDIKFTRYPDNFLLNTVLGENGYKLEVLDMKLHLHSIERRERVLSPTIERYLMNQTELHKQVVARGSHMANFRILHGNVLPKTIVLAMASTTAIDGSYQLNPFNFHHFFVTNISLLINGEQFPSGGLPFNFEAGANALVSRAYSWMFENTGCADGQKGNIVSWNAFQQGALLVPFDLTPDR